MIIIADNCLTKDAGSGGGYTPLFPLEAYFAELGCAISAEDSEKLLDP